MSISNLSSDPGFNSIATRTAFARDEVGQRLANVVERYQNTPAPTPGDAEEVREGLKLLLSQQPEVNYEDVATALLARLDALRDLRLSAESEALRDKSFDLMKSSQPTSDEPSMVALRTPRAPKHGRHPDVPRPVNPPPSAPAPEPAPAPQAPPSAPTAPAPPPSPPEGLTASGKINIPAGYHPTVALDHLAITAEVTDPALSWLGMGIEAGNATTIGSFSLTNSTIDSDSYGIYMASAESFTVADTRITAHVSGEPYCVRLGSTDQLNITNCTFDNAEHLPSAPDGVGKNSLRIGRCESGVISNTTIRGGYLWLGLGPGNVKEDWQNFSNFTMSDVNIDCTVPHGAVPALEFGSLVGQAGPVVLERVNVTGNSFAMMHPGAQVTFRDCTFNGQPLEESSFHHNSSLAGVTIEHTAA